MRCYGMRNFEFHIHDDLALEPQVYFVDVRDLARAREVALSFLARDPTRRLAHILSAGQLIETLERPIHQPASPREAGFDLS